MNPARHTRSTCCSRSSALASAAKAGRVRCEITTPDMPAAAASASPGALAVRRCAGVALLLLVLTTESGAALAQDQSESFSATVKVDATADTAAAARDLARIDGQRRALGLVIDRLSGSSENAKLARL